MESQIRTGLRRPRLPGGHSCRRIGCDKYGCGKKYDYFCKNDFAKYSNVNKELTQLKERLHQEQVNEPASLMKTLHEKITQQSCFKKDDIDGDVHLKRNLLGFHMWAGDDLSKLKLNSNGEIELMRNIELGRQYLEQSPHWKTMRNDYKKPNNEYIWLGTGFLECINFIIKHHGITPKKGDAWHCLVCTPRNKVYPRLHQHRLKSGGIAKGHGCMIRAKENMVPCLILKLTFTKDGLSLPNITVVRANGKMKMEDAIDVDAKEKGVFRITETGIEYSPK